MTHRPATRSLLPAGRGRLVGDALGDEVVDFAVVEAGGLDANLEEEALDLGQRVCAKGDLVGRASDAYASAGHS